MRKLLSFSLSVSLLLSLVSCDLDTNNSTTEASSNAKISAFRIYNDSIPALKKAIFKVDQDAMTIANEDSIEYGSSLDSCYIQMVSIAKLITIGEKLYVGKLDTLKFDLNKPLDISTVALDGISKLKYSLKVNVHHVDPDTMIWKPILSEITSASLIQEGSIYFNSKAFYYYKDASGIHAMTSQKGKTWTSATVTGLDASVDLHHVIVYKDKLLLSINNTLYVSKDGLNFAPQAINGVQVSHLLYSMNDSVYGLQITGKSLKLVGTKDLTTWIERGDLPAKFPVLNASIYVSKSASGKVRVQALGGQDIDGNLLNSMWATENNTYWANLMSGTTIKPIENATLLKYGSRLMLVGGKTADGLSEDIVLFSKDGGLSWDKPSEKEVVNPLFVGRYNCNIVDMQNGTLVLIGGQTSDTQFVKDAWTALLYKAMPNFKN